MFSTNCVSEEPDVTSTFNPLEPSNNPLSDVSELRQRTATDGYIFVKRLVNPDNVMALRRQILAVIQAGGWIPARTDPRVMTRNGLCV